MGAPVLRTSSFACLPARESATSTAPPSSTYLQALSMSVPAKRRSRCSLPRSLMPGSTCDPSFTPRSNATDSNCRTSPSMTSDRSTSSRAGRAAPDCAAASSSSIFASVSRSPTSPCMASASCCVLSSHWLWLATLRSGCSSAMDVLARITVSGVFRSCDASATKRRCCVQARATGRSAQRLKNRLMTRNTASAATSTTASVAARARQPLALPMSANARYMTPPA